MATSAMRDGNEWVLVGEKTYISNGGIADFYLTFARTGEGEGVARPVAPSSSRPTSGLKLSSASKSSRRIRWRG